MAKMTLEQAKRIKHIKLLMVETGMKPKQIASETGISLSYFYAIMEGHRIGEKPTAYAVKMEDLLTSKVIA